MQKEGFGGEVKRAEPMLRASRSSVLRSETYGATRGDGAADAPARSAGASAALPCLTVTTALEQEKGEDEKPLPGPRKKQADALTENIKWMASVLGKERVGFLTLTLGD